MIDAEIQDYRQRLLALKDRLDGDVSGLEEEARRPIGGEASGGLSDVPLHLADLGTDNYEEEVTLALLENQEQILAEIDEALARIAQGEFGRCQECGQEISRERLEAVPYTRYCRQHARQ
jgi:RNA polymerase-binding transcription factor DksA